MNKNEQIKKTLLETRQRRATQRCLVYEFKIDISKLNKKEFEKLKFMFIQCKWLYNYLLNLEDINSYDTKSNNIYSLDKAKNKIERILDIPAKLKQNVYTNLKQNLQTLKGIKKKGRKVGKLKFKSEYNSIDLNQYGITHEIKEKGIRVNGFKRLFKVRGLKQLKNKKYEYANAKLIQKADGFYIKITCFENLTLSRIEKPIKEVGLDFGIKTHITTSDNEKFNITVEESKRLKGLQKKLARQVKHSNNSYRTIKKLRKEYEKLYNLKKDKGNKLVNYLCSNYSTVYMQDEMVGNWHKGLFGKQVQHSCLGYIKAKLKAQNNIVVIDKSYPTTKLCYNCGELNKDITLKDRTFICPNCGHTEDRDLKAAKTILFIGQCKNTYIPTEHRNTDVEKMSDFLSSYKDNKQSSLKHRSSTPLGVG